MVSSGVACMIPSTCIGRSDQFSKLKSSYLGVWFLSDFTVLVQVGPPRRATADATAATETSELSRQQKWCLKWQTRRLKRKADTLAATTPTQAEGSKQRKKVNAAVTTTEGPSDKKTGKKTGKKRAATDAQKPPPKKAKQHGDDKTKPQPKDARNRGNRSRRRRPDVEETSLETMVNKYRSKLDKNSLSKWSQ